MIEPIVGIIGAALYLLGFAMCAILCVDKIAKKKGDSSKIASLRRFFRSEWFGVLTTVDPEWLISKLEREFKKGGGGT